MQLRGGNDEAHPAVAWRRTTRGWEPRLMWQLHAPRPVNPAARLHPALVATFLGLFSVGALWAFERTEREP